MPTAYKEVGVLSADEMPSFDSALRILKGTFGFSANAVSTKFGYYAAVIKLSDDLGIAVSTDGVGTKLLVAQELGKFDTVGIDCVAMNANDVVCVGATPLTMVDYIAVESAAGTQLRDIAIGLKEGARLARISIPGGETAQIPQMLHETEQKTGFDLVGTCVGTVPMSRMIIGEHVAKGDAVVGFAASGIHSNGLTLARRVLLQDVGWSLSSHVPEFGRTLGEELLEPSRIYVGLALDLLRALDVRGLAHITSDGFLNLRRVAAPVGFNIEFLPPPPPIFDVIQRVGNVPDEDMYSVYNMGIGFCVIVPDAEASAAIAIGKACGFDSWLLGHATDSPEKWVRVLPKRIEGNSGHFQPMH